MFTSPIPRTKRRAAGSTINSHTGTNLNSGNSTIGKSGVSRDRLPQNNNAKVSGKQKVASTLANAKGDPSSSIFGGSVKGSGGASVEASQIKKRTSPFKSRTPFAKSALGFDNSGNDGSVARRRESGAVFSKPFGAESGMPSGSPSKPVAKTISGSGGFFSSLIERNNEKQQQTRLNTATGSPWFTDDSERQKSTDAMASSPFAQHQHSSPSSTLRQQIDKFASDNQDLRSESEETAAGLAPNPGRAYPRTLLKTNEHTVTALAEYPIQVRSALNSIDFSQVPVYSSVSSSGAKFAVVATPTVCYVWSISSSMTASSGNPNKVFALPVPDPPSGEATAYETPLVALVSTNTVSSASDSSKRHGGDLHRTASGMDIVQDVSDAYDDVTGDTGVLICSPSGLIRYWDRVAFGLGGANKFLSLTLPISEKDECCDLVQLGSIGYVVATRSGHLFLITLTNAQLNAELFARPIYKNDSGVGGIGAESLGSDTTPQSGGSLFSRVTSLFGGSSTQSGGGYSVLEDSSEYIISLIQGNHGDSRQSHELFVLTPRFIQKWIISKSLPSRLVYSVDILAKISQRIGQIKPKKGGRLLSDDSALYLIDCAVANDGSICILMGAQDPSTSSNELVLCTLNPPTNTTNLTFNRLQILNHSSPEPFDTEGVCRPRIALPNGGPGAFIITSDTVVLTTIYEIDAANTEETINFRESDFILGFGCSRSTTTANQTLGNYQSKLILTSVRTGLIEMTIDISTLTQSMSSSAMQLADSFGYTPSAQYEYTGHPSDSINQDDIQHYQRQIEQAVFFGSENQDNPLAFHLSALSAKDKGAALNMAAINVSNSIVSGSSQFLAARLALLPHLNERVRLAHNVTQFIFDSGLIDTLSFKTKLILRSNVEKLTAASELWQYLNGQWSSAETDNLSGEFSPAITLLEKTIISFIEETLPQFKEELAIDANSNGGAGDNEDEFSRLIRGYFRQCVGTLGDLAIYLHQKLPLLFNKLSSRTTSSVRLSHLVIYETNRITITILNAAFSYRYKFSESLYNMAKSVTSEDSSNLLSWTEEPLITQMLIDQYHRSYNLCSEISQGYNSRLHRQITESVLPGDSDNGKRNLDVFSSQVIIRNGQNTQGGGDDERNLRNLEETNVDNVYISPRGLLYTVIDQIAQVINLTCRSFANRVADIQTSMTLSAKSNSASSGSQNHIDPALDESMKLCVAQYDRIRPHMLTSLVTLDKIPAALRLAEEYRDFKSLIVIVFASQPPTHNHKASNNNITSYPIHVVRPERLERYIDQYGKEFSFMLYDYYYERKEWWSLTETNDPIQDEWLREYFVENIDTSFKPPTAADKIDERYEKSKALLEVSWVHDIKLNDFGKAAEKLTRIGPVADLNNTRQTLLSLDKLTLLAEIGNINEGDENVQLAMETLEDYIELSYVQNQLVDEYENRLAAHYGHRIGSSVEKGDDGTTVFNEMMKGYSHSHTEKDKKAVLDIAAITTDENFRHQYPSLYKLYIILVNDVWNGQSLSPEHFVDILTLATDVEYRKENPMNNSDNDDDVSEDNTIYPVLPVKFSMAINIITSSIRQLSVLGAFTALQTAWRRVYLSDDWSMLHSQARKNTTTDEKLIDMLCSTNLYTVLLSYHRNKDATKDDDDNSNQDDDDGEVDQYLLEPKDCIIQDNESLNYLVQTRRQEILNRYTNRQNNVDQDGGRGVNKTGDAFFSKSLANFDASQLTLDYQREQDLLVKYIELMSLDKYYAEITHLVKKQLAEINQSQRHQADNISFARNVVSDDQMQLDDDNEEF
ncbi:hypothetical protein H4219_003556 [Mycoemilia scoparia]|uniref:Nucleoporin Nup133/Nup155-like C-terminal domain-containing protein n=1 Tax=Mycoemilia scoparia TaxID=417184 RepID=A0A9W7ZV74_9FUNG|nr:hypothetical protein H4219_003556 [Mycoemilia scoparia]